MNTKEIAEKYSLNLDKLNMVVLNSDLKYKKTMFNGIEVEDSAELVLEKYNSYFVEKEEKALAEKAAEEERARVEEEEKRIKEEEQKRIEEEEQKKRKELAEKYREARIKAKDIIVTTGDIKDEYEIIGPVIFHMTKRGLIDVPYKEIQDLHMSEIEIMKSGETVSQERKDWTTLYGEMSLGSFESIYNRVFYIAVQELKVRAAFVGGDAVISMRQNIYNPNLDANSNFSMQMYGTAVKLRRQK